MYVERIGKKYIAQYQPKVGRGTFHISQLLPAIGEGKTRVEAIARAFEDMKANNNLFHV